MINKNEIREHDPTIIQTILYDLNLNYVKNNHQESSNRMKKSLQNDIPEPFPAVSAFCTRGGNPFFARRSW